jgi:hypothetical protein
MARPEDSEQVLSAGFHLHLAKPIDIENWFERFQSSRKSLQKATRVN